MASGPTGTQVALAAEVTCPICFERMSAAKELTAYVDEVRLCLPRSTPYWTSPPYLPQNRTFDLTRRRRRRRQFNADRDTKRSSETAGWLLPVRCCRIPRMSNGWFRGTWKPPPPDSVLGCGHLPSRNWCLLDTTQGKGSQKQTWSIGRVLNRRGELCRSFACHFPRRICIAHQLRCLCKHHLPDPGSDNGQLNLTSRPSSRAHTIYLAQGRGRSCLTAAEYR